MAALEASVPDVPEDVKIQLQRTAFLEKKVREFALKLFGESTRSLEPHPKRRKSATPHFQPCR